MAIRPRQRRTARLVVLVGGVTALIAAGVAARWWIRWPERVREQLATLVSEGEFGKANRLLAGGAEWQNPELPAFDALPRRTLHDGAGETLELSFEEWKELFTGQSFTAGARTSADYLHARQMLEVRVPGSHRLKVRKIGRGRRATVFSPKRLEVTIERGAVSVRLVDEYVPTLEGWSL